MQSLPISYLKDPNQLIFMMDSCYKYADTIILNNEDGIGKYVPDGCHFGRRVNSTYDSVAG